MNVDLRRIAKQGKRDDPSQVEREQLSVLLRLAAIQKNLRRAVVGLRSLSR